MFKQLKLWKVTVLAIIFLGVIFLFSNHAFAHSGRTDSSGGHNCYVGSCAGTYHYHNGGYNPAPSVYIPPACTKPTLGENAKWDFVANGCDQDVSFSWDKGFLDEYYSIQISKTPGANPGPLSDTSQTKFKFNNIKPGKWYVNVKAGRSCGWGDINYWTIDVPDVTPYIDFKGKVINENERQLIYDVSCADKIEITPEIGIVKEKSGTITINPQQGSDYKLTATNKKEKNHASISVKYPSPEEKTNKPDDTEKITTNEKSYLSGGWGEFASLAFVGGFAWLINKIATKKQ